MSYALPRTLTLPSGARTTIRRRAGKRNAGREHHGLFAETLDRIGREIEIVQDGRVRDALDLPLVDFHVIRAVLTKAGIVGEEETELDCHNCGAKLFTRPCAALETGPWEDGEANDDELDVTAPFGEKLEVEPVRVGRVRQIRSVTLAPRTVREALPLFEARASDAFEIDEAIVKAMGIAALDANEDPAAIANTLARGGEAAIRAVGDAFIEAHYPLRLSSDVFCTQCKARNRIDAPFVRELEHSNELERAAVGAFPPLPSLEDFVERTHAIAEPLVSEIPGEAVEVVVEDGTPDVDDGGEPLLGSYVPPPPHGALAPMRPPRVTVYYRTFQRIEMEEGPFDWESELRETIEHELEHHVYWLRGDDPMDEEEHAEIDREVLRVVGRGESTRRTLSAFGQSFTDFFVRAWPLVVIFALAIAIWFAEMQCGQGSPAD